jgi:integrase
MELQYGRSDQFMIDADILPHLKHLKVAEVTFSDIDALHRHLTRQRKVPIQANRVVALLSKMFSLAIKWRMRADNPARGIERNQETKRRRYLSGDELIRFTEALGEHKDQDAANAIHLLLLTGARRAEVLSSKWDQFDLEAGVWTKAGSTTKQKTEHRVPLSAPARQLLVDLKSESESDFVFPGRGGEHRIDLRRSWAGLCGAAGISGVHLHDLRHTYVSILASAGNSLPVIGALLGHSQAATTHRYAHLFDDPLRKATETAGAIIIGKAQRRSPHYS